MEEGTAEAEAEAVTEAGPKMRRSSPVRKILPVMKTVVAMVKAVVAMVKAVEDLDMCCTPRCP